MPRMGASGAGWDGRELKIGGFSKLLTGDSIDAHLAVGLGRGPEGRASGGPATSRTGLVAVRTVGADTVEFGRSDAASDRGKPPAEFVARMRYS